MFEKKTIVKIDVPVQMNFQGKEEIKLKNLKVKPLEVEISHPRNWGEEELKKYVKKFQAALIERSLCKVENSKKKK
ncbi:MAG: hypothetical protein ACOCQR_02045 [bacterium]